MTNLVDAGMKLVEGAPRPRRAPQSDVQPAPALQPQIPGITWENVPKARFFKLQGAKDLPAMDANGQRIDLGPRQIVRGTFVGQVDGANIRGRDGDFSFTDLVTVLEARIVSAESL